MKERKNRYIFPKISRPFLWTWGDPWELHENKIKNPDGSKQDFELIYAYTLQEARLMKLVSDFMEDAIENASPEEGRRMVQNLMRKLEAKK